MAAFELRGKDGKPILLNKEWSRFGRAEDNDIVVKDSSVSRYHLNFYVKDEQLIAEDAGSQNGFLVNGKTITTAVQLRPGDKLFVGASEYIVRIPGMIEPKAPPAATSYQSFDASATPIGDDSTQKRIRIYAIAVISLALFAFLSKNNDKAAVKAEDAGEFTDRPSPPSKPNHRTKSPSEIRSESLFREAMRDYENGNYSRALLGFRDSRTLNPENEEALNYIEFSETRLTNEMAELLKDANRSLKYLQYRRGKNQAARVLSILSEQIPGYGKKIAQEASGPTDQKRAGGQEETLIQIQCDKTRSADLCNKALEIIREARRLLGEEDTWQ